MYVRILMIHCSPRDGHRPCSFERDKQSSLFEMRTPPSLSQMSSICKSAAPLSSRSCSQHRVMVTPSPFNYGFFLFRGGGRIKEGKSHQRPSVPRPSQNLQPDKLDKLSLNPERCGVHACMQGAEQKVHACRIYFPGFCARVLGFDERMKGV